MKKPARQVSFFQALAFAGPGVAVAWLIPPMYAILADFYLRYTSATAAGVGTAMIASKIIDAITDPPVGFFSDHTKSALGARKPWIIAGCLLSMATFLYLFNPGEGAGNLHFTIGIVLYYVAYTFINIPYRSWLGELTQDYSERTRVWAYFTIALLVGGVIIMALPILLSSPLLPIFDTPEFDRDMISFIGWVGVILMPLTIIPAILFTPTGKRNEGAPPTINTFFNVLKDCQPFQMFMLGYGASALGFGLFYSVIIIVLTSYFGFADRIPLFMLFMVAAQVVTIPMWEKLGGRFSKHRVWAAAWAAHVVVAPMILLFGPNTAHFWPLVFVGSLTSILQGPHMLFPAAIVNDIVDSDTLETGRSRAGNFMSVYTFIDKVLHAVGFGVGYYIIAAFNYDPKASAHSAWEVFGLMTAAIGLPSLFFALSAFFLFRFPIDAARHRAIREGLAERDARKLEPHTPETARS